MKVVKLNQAVRVALLYGIRGLASADDTGIISQEESRVGMTAMRQWRKLPPVLQSVLAVRDLFAAVCSEFRASPTEYDELLLEFFDKDFRVNR